MSLEFLNHYFYHQNTLDASWNCRLSFSLVVGFDLDKARLSRPHFGSKTWPPRSSRFWTNQSGDLNQLALSVAIINVNRYRVTR